MMVATIIFLLLIPTSGLADARGRLPANSAQSSGPMVSAAKASGQKVIDLGSQSGPKGVGWLSVNDSGEVAGYEKVRTVFTAARWKNGVVTTFGTGPSAALAISDSGTLFGAYSGKGANYPIRWDATGQHVDLTKPGPEDGGFHSSSPNGIAIGRQQAGCPNNFCVFVSAPPSYADKAIPMLSYGWSVNNLGHVAGSNTAGDGLFYAGGSTVNTGVALNGFYGNHALNIHDAIVGNLKVGPATTTASMWHAGHVTRLPDLKSAPAGDAHPEAINDSNVIVGKSDSTGAVIWQSGVIRTLDSLLAKRSPWHLTDAVDISNSGYILGTGTLSGQTHYFLTQIGAGVKLSGTQWVTDCTDRSCSRAGAVGDRLAVSGTASSGNKISVSAASGPGGRWSANVPTGSYTITPDAGFVPDSKTVVAKGNVAGIDFATCGPLRSSASHADVLTKQSTGRPDTASGQKGCPDGIDWKLLDRTGEVPALAAKTPWGILRQKDIYAPFSVHLYLSVQGSQVKRCAAGSVWKWAVSRKPAGAHVLAGPSSPGCDSQMIVDKQGPYQVTARRYVKGNLRETVTHAVQVRDLLIVAMGDSNGSGEGSPPFWFNQCNRGSASYQYQAAGLLESQAGLHTSATFVSASCSSARIAHLVNTPYAGVRPGTPLPAEIKQIQDALRPPAHEPRRKADAALVSIGINDLAFGPILKYCVKIANLYGTACEDILTRAEPATGPVNDFVADSKSKTTLGDLIDRLIKELPSKYSQLSSALATSGLVQRSQVYLTQYPSFAYKDNKGDLCTSYGSGLSGIQNSTWKWLSFEGAKLNNAVLYASAAHGWNSVQVPRQLFFGHGYCSSDPWFVGITESRLNSNPDGAFHPTVRGAHVTAVVTLEHLCRLLGDKRFCTNFPQP
jgi:hypothetical protein